MIVPGSAFGSRFFGGGGTPPRCDYKGFISQPTASATPIASAFNVPNPNGTRRLVAMAIAFGPPSGVASSMVIGGVGATLAVNNRIGTGTIMTWGYANVPTGTSVSVNMTYPSTTSNSGLHCYLWEVDGMISWTPVVYHDAATPFTMSTTFSLNSAAMFGFTVYQNGGTSTNWTNVVETDDRYISLAGVSSVASFLANSGAAGYNITAAAVSGSTNAAQSGGLIFT